MSNKKGSRGIPVNMNDLAEELGDHASKSPIAFTLGNSFVLSSKPMSTKARKQEAEAAAAAVAAAEAAEAAKQAESDRLYKEYMKMHQPPKPPKSVTCALCKKRETVGDAIAHKWKKHPFGFANQAICAACDAATVPFTASPKFVPVKPDMLSARHAKLLKVLDHAETPPNALKAQVVASSALFEPLDPAQRLSNLQGMRHQLSAALLTPLAGIEPFRLKQTKEFKESINSRHRGGTRRTKSKSKSKSKSRSKSRTKSKSRTRF